MQNLTVTIPHRLGKAEARRRIEGGVREVRQQYGVILSRLEEHWDGDTLSFSAAAMGQTVWGQIVVEESQVRVEVALPWMLALLGGVVRQHLEQRGHRLLGARPAGDSSDPQGGSGGERQ
jgi:putative polyhydroxyalkanoate system protein